MKSAVSPHFFSVCGRVFFTRREGRGADKSTPKNKLLDIRLSRVVQKMLSHFWDIMPLTSRAHPNQIVLARFVRMKRWKSAPCALELRLTNSHSQANKGAAGLSEKLRFLAFFWRARVVGAAKNSFPKRNPPPEPKLILGLLLAKAFSLGGSSFHELDE